MYWLVLLGFYEVLILGIIDDDECSRNNGGCNQTCFNTEGSYNCTCISGYSLDDDGLGCSGIVNDFNYNN